MSTLVKGVFIVAAKRTPFGTYGGALAKTSALDLAEVAAKSAIGSINLSPEKIDHVIIGQVMPNSSPDGIMLARHLLLKCGIPIDRPAYSVNRLCGSSFQSIVNGVQSILTGESEIVLTGGTESMSQVPHNVRNLRFGAPPLGTRIDFEDYLLASGADSYARVTMGQTAENLAIKYKLSRDEIDQFALRSQLLWKKAQDEGRFKEELAPVIVNIKKKQVTVEIDEHPRPQTTIEALKKLPPAFVKDGVVTAGSSSGVNDGAGVVILASEKAVKENNLKPLARIMAANVVGVDPTIMGIGPVPAIRNVLKFTNKALNDLEIVEINEAFGAQTVACAKELNLDMDKLNPDGGAISIGHPVGASGARITGHLVHELRRRKAKYAVGSACMGGGQGIAIMLESC